MEQQKVKAVWWNDPTRTREFTKQGLEYAGSPTGWVLAEDQSGVGVEKKTNQGANPAVIANLNSEELQKARENYKAATGNDAPPEWREPKLFIETMKALKKKEAEPGPVTIEVDTDAPEEKPAPKKRGPKPKTPAEV